MLGGEMTAAEQPWSALGVDLLAGRPAPTYPGIVVRCHMQLSGNSAAKHAYTCASFNQLPSLGA